MTLLWIALAIVAMPTVLGLAVWALLPDKVTFDAKTVCVPDGDGLHLQPLRVLGNRVSWTSLAVSVGGMGLLALAGPPVMVGLAWDDLRGHLDEPGMFAIGGGALLLAMAVGVLLLWVARGLLRTYWSADPVVEIRFRVEDGRKVLDIRARGLLRRRAWQCGVEEVRQVYVACRQQVDQVGLVGGGSVAAHASLRPFLLLRDAQPLALMAWGRDGPGARRFVEMIRAWCGVEAVFDDRYDATHALNFQHRAGV